jgi:uncharacterized membrane protein
MQAATNPTLDANAAHSPEIREDDPRHLGNLTKKMNKINGQVSADTKYDPAPPPRVDSKGNIVKESFVAEIPPSDLKLEEQFLHIIRCGVFLVLVGILVTMFDPDMRNYLFSVKYGITFLIIGFILSVIALLVISSTQRNIDIERWYPYPV